MVGAGTAPPGDFAPPGPPRAPDEPPLRTVRLDIEGEGAALRDGLLWPCGPASGGAPALAPEHLARQIVRDSALPASFEGRIVEALRAQVLRGRWEAGAEARIAPLLAGVAGGAERLHRLTLDISINEVAVRDSLLWDISQSDANADFYAQCYCRDLALPADLVGPVAHALRTQIAAARAAVEKGEDARAVTAVRAVMRDEDVARWSPAVAWGAEVPPPPTPLRLIGHAASFTSY